MNKIQSIYESIKSKKSATLNSPKCEEEQNVPISEQGLVNESIQSKKFATLNSPKSINTGTTPNNIKSRSEEKDVVKRVPSNPSTGSLRSPDKIQATTTSNKLPIVSKSWPHENCASPSIKPINRSSPSIGSFSRITYNARPLKSALITNTCTEK